MFNLNIFKKYTISYNLMYDDILYEHLICLTRPIKVVQIYNYPNGETREFIIPKGSVVWCHGKTGIHKDLVEINIKSSYSGFSRSISGEYDYKGRFFVNINFLKEYSIPYRKNLKVEIINFSNYISLDQNKLDCKEKYVKEIYSILFFVTDIFKNYEAELVSKFAPGIIDSLETFKILMQSNHTDKEKVLNETLSYLENIEKTLSSFGDNIKYFPSPLSLVEEYHGKQKNEEERVRLEKEKEQETYQKLQEDFLERLKYRKELLNDFNEPLINIPSKLIKKNQEIDTRWNKEI